MKVRENHKPLPGIPFEDAKAIFQKELNEAYNKVIPFNHPIWDTFEYIAPRAFINHPLNID